MGRSKHDQPQREVRDCLAINDGDIQFRPEFDDEMRRVFGDRWDDGEIHKESKEAPSILIKDHVRKRLTSIAFLAAGIREASDTQLTDLQKGKELRSIEKIFRKALNKASIIDEECGNRRLNIPICVEEEIKNKTAKPHSNSLTSDIADSDCSISREDIEHMLTLVGNSYVFWMHMQQDLKNLMPPRKNIKEINI